jgi:hypothetical protein
MDIKELKQKFERFPEIRNDYPSISILLSRAESGESIVFWINNLRVDEEDEELVLYMLDNNDDVTGSIGIKADIIREIDICLSESRYVGQMDDLEFQISIEQDAPIGMKGWMSIDWGYTKEKFKGE